LNHVKNLVFVPLYSVKIIHCLRAFSPMSERAEVKCVVDLSYEGRAHLAACVTNRIFVDAYMYTGFGSFWSGHLILGGRRGDCVRRRGRRETSLRACEFNADVTDAMIGLAVGDFWRGDVFHLIRFDKVTNRRRSWSSECLWYLKRWSSIFTLF